MADVTSVNQIVITAKDETGQAFASAKRSIQDVGAQTGLLKAQLAELQGSFNNLDQAIQRGAFANADQLLDKTMGAMRQQMSALQSQIAQIGTAGSSGFGKAADGADKLTFATAGVTREFVILGHEALQGNFSRIPGSILVLLERLGNLHVLLSATGAIFGGVAAAVLVLIAAFVKGSEEAEAMNAAIAKSGNFAGVTRGEMLAMAEAISSAGQVTVGTAKEIVTQLVASGKVGADALQPIVNAIVEYARVTGEDASKATTDLTKLFADPAKGARELIDTVGGVSVATEEYVRHLQQQGEVTQAQVVLADALRNKLHDQEPQLGALQKAWEGLKGAASAAWNAMLNIGRPDTLEQKIASQLTAIAQIQNQLQVRPNDVNAQARLAAAQKLLDTLNAQYQTEQAQAQAQAENNDLTRKQLLAQDAVNKGQLSQIANLRDEITLIQKYGDGSAAANQRIAEDQKQIASIYRSMDADRRAQIEAQITEQQKLADIGLDAESSQVDAQLKLGQISQIEHDKRMTQIALERNENAISAQQQLLQIGTLDAKERAAAQARLSELAAQRELIQQQGDNKILEDQQALLDTITKIHGELPAFSSDFLKMQKDLADAYSQGLISLKQYADLTNQLLAQQPFAVRWREAQAAIEKTNGAYQDFINKIQDGLEKQKQAIDDLGKMPDQIARANAELQVQQTIEKELNDLATKYAIALEKNPEQAALLVKQINDLLDRQGLLVSQAGDLAEQYVKAKRSLDDWKSVLSGVADEGAKFISDFVQHGSSAFKNLWNDFKTWALEAFAKIAAQTIIVNIAAAFGGTAQSAANQLFGIGGSQSNPLLNLLGLGTNINFGLPGMFPGWGGSNGPLSFLSPTNLATSFANSPVGQYLGLSYTAPLVQGAGTAAAFGPAVTAPALEGFGGGTAAAFGPEAGSFGASLLTDTATPIITAETAAAAGTTTALTAAGSFLTAAAPFIPFLAAIPLIGSLFGSKEPSQVHAQFQVAPTGTGASQFEGGAGGTVASPFGDLGFNDAATMYFSGSAGTALSQVVAGALNAFLPRLTGAQQRQLSTTLQGTNFGTFEGSYTTEDFIKQYGGQILQKVVVAAFDVLDPALASVAQGFTGTADDVAKFSNSLLGIYDATKAIGNADFTKNVDAALQGADQATADKVLAFVTIVQQAGNALDGLSQHMQALDPANITKFVDALGGAQQALQGVAFINANFTTAADKAVAAQTALTNSWNAAGLTTADLARANLTTFPQTHEQFLQLLNSFDLNTQHGRDLAAALINSVAPAFVAVMGTADAAAASLRQQAQTGQDYYNQHFLTPDEQHQLDISNTETALYNATKGGTALHDALVSLGFDVIPTTVEGVRKLNDAIIAKYGADSQEEQELLRIIPTIGHLNDITGAWGDTVQQVTAQVGTSVGVLTGAGEDQAQKLLSNIDTLVNGIDDFGQKLTQKATLLAKTLQAIPQTAFDGSGYRYLGSDLTTKAYVNEINGIYLQTADELARFTTLSAQYGASIAEQLVGLEDWYNQEKQIFAGNATALAAAQTIFDQKWKAIITGTSNGVNGTLDQLAKLKQGIADYLKGLAIGDLSPLTPRQKLDQAQQAYVEELIKAQGGDQTALGDITKFADAYLKQAQSYYSSATSPYLAIFSNVTSQLGALAGTGPNGLPTNPVTAIVAALPTNGTLASSSDINRLISTLQTENDSLRQTVTDLITALADANSADAQKQADATTAAAQLTVAAAGSGR